MKEIWQGPCAPRALNPGIMCQTSLPFGTSASWWHISSWIKLTYSKIIVTISNIENLLYWTIIAPLSKLCWSREVLILTPWSLWEVTSLNVKSTICTLDNGLTVRNISSFYHAVFSFRKRHLVYRFFFNFDSVPSSAIIKIHFVYIPEGNMRKI
jgi:hypothetical protein